jgi:hypothetical protein
MTVDLNETDDEEEGEQPVPAKKGKGKGKAAEPIPEEDEEEVEELEMEDLEEESEDEFAADREDAALGSEDDEEEDQEDDDDDDDEEDEEMSEAELPSDLSDDEPDTLEGLDSFVDELDAADRKRRADKGIKAEVAKTKRRVLPVSSGLSKAQATSKSCTVKLCRARVLVLTRRWQARSVDSDRLAPIARWGFWPPSQQSRQQVLLFHLETRSPTCPAAYYRPGPTRPRGSIRKDQRGRSEMVRRHETNQGSRAPSIPPPSERTRWGQIIRRSHWIVQSAKSV